MKLYKFGFCLTHRIVNAQKKFLHFQTRGTLYLPICSYVRAPKFRCITMLQNTREIKCSTAQQGAKPLIAHGSEMNLKHTKHFEPIYCRQSFFWSIWWKYHNDYSLNYIPKDLQQHYKCQQECLGMYKTLKISVFCILYFM